MAESTGEQQQFDVTNPAALGKLNGIQLAVTSMEQEAMRIQEGIPIKRGMVQACALLSERIKGLIDAVQEDLRAEKIEPDEARARIDSLKAAFKQITDLGSESTGEMVNIRARSEGMRLGADKLAKQWKLLAQKYERQERVEREAEEAEREAEAAESEPEPAPKAPKAKASKPNGGVKKTTKKSKKPAKKANPAEN